MICSSSAGILSSLPMFEVGVTRRQTSLVAGTATRIMHLANSYSRLPKRGVDDCSGSSSGDMFVEVLY